MPKIFRVNETVIDGDGLIGDGLLVEVMSAEAVDTGASFVIRKGELALAAQIIPKGKAAAWGIADSREAALALARKRAEKLLLDTEDGLRVARDRLKGIDALAHGTTEEV